jgi:hypothetical protein
MAFYSRVTYTGAAGQAYWAVSFPFIQRSHVSVYLDTVLQADGVDYTWATDAVIQFTVAPADGVVILLERRTPITGPLVDFQNGAQLTESDLDTTAQQAVYLAQELQDDALSVGATFTTTDWPQTAAELAAAITPVRTEYEPGNLKRYTSNDGDGLTDVSGAFDDMLNCGERRCILPAPTTSWRINSTVTWVPEVEVHGAIGTLIESYVAATNYTFEFRDIRTREGTGFYGFDLTLKTAGNHGILVWQSSNCGFDRFVIDGEVAATAGIGFHIDGGDDGDPEYGAAFNRLGDQFMIRRCSVGLKLFTENTTTPADTTAFCNRNSFGHGTINGCTTAMDIDRANTNHIDIAPEGSVTQHMLLGQYCSKNRFNCFMESAPTAITNHASMDQNVFMGNVDITDFANPLQRTNSVHSVKAFALPYPVYVLNSAIEYENETAGSTINIRTAAGSTSDVIYGIRDTSDVSTGLLRFKRDAAPYVGVMGVDLRLESGARLRWVAGDTQTTVGAAGGASALPATPTGYAKISIAGTDRVVPYYAVLSNVVAVQTQN